MRVRWLKLESVIREKRRSAIWIICSSLPRHDHEILCSRDNHSIITERKKPQSSITMTTNRSSSSSQSSSHHYNLGALSSALVIIIITATSHALRSSSTSPIIRSTAAFGSSSFLIIQSPQRRRHLQRPSSSSSSSAGGVRLFSNDNHGIDEDDIQSSRKRQPRRSSTVTTKKSSTAKSTTTAINNNKAVATNNNSTSASNPNNDRQSQHSRIASPPIYNPKIVSGAPYQRAEMMEHTILTRGEEFKYGRRVVRAREVREGVEEFLEGRRAKEEIERLRVEEEEMRLLTNYCENDVDIIGEYFEEDGVLHNSIINDGEVFGNNNNVDDAELNEHFLSYELEYLSLYGFRPSIQDFENDMEGEGVGNAINSSRGAAVTAASSSASSSATTLGGFDLEDDLLIDHAQHRSHHMSQLRNQDAPRPPVASTKRSGYRNSSSSSTAASNSYTPLLHIPLHELSESDVISTLNIPGGRTELVNILLDGAYGREVLMRRNVKLVTSIAKQWMRNSFSTQNANLGTSSSASSNNSGRSTRKYLSQMYEGSWDRPSLDEAVQEGMLGLARAVDKYDPERGLRFSTYATHWITSYVRVCFQRAVTGCLRVPSQLHDIKSAYQKIIKDHLVSGEEPPEQTVIAKTLGITPQRLSTAIRATGTLVSVDAPVISPGSGSYKGSAAGGDGGNSRELLILDTLKCAEPKPEDQVEISFLRQCLENAMASELTPYERDVLRLRLGLDSGTGKTVREIVEICGGGVTMSDVRSAERRAFKKLRSPTSVHTHNLLAYLDLAGADINFR